MEHHWKNFFWHVGTWTRVAGVSQQTCSLLDHQASPVNNNVFLSCSISQSCCSVFLDDVVQKGGLYHVVQLCLPWRCRAKGSILSCRRVWAFRSRGRPAATPGGSTRWWDSCWDSRNRRLWAAPGDRYSTPSSTEKWWLVVKEKMVIGSEGKNGDW